jgi:translation initiation factor 1
MDSNSDNIIFMPTGTMGLNFQNQFEESVQSQKIHVRFQKTGPRSITIVEGLDDDLDLRRISKAMKKNFNCSASIHSDKAGNEVIQLQGDQRENVKAWLLEHEILTQQSAKERLVLHGF